MGAKQKEADQATQDAQNKEKEENIESAANVEVLNEGEQDYSPKLKNVSEYQLTTTSSSDVPSSGQPEEIIDQRALQRLKDLEAQVQVSLHIVGGELRSSSRCLKEIKDYTLYELEGFKTWKAYIEAKFPFTLRYANYHITFVEVFDLITQTNSEEHSVPLPTSEAQTRALAGLTDEEVLKVWATSCQASDNKVPNRHTVTEKAREVKAENKQRQLQGKPKKKKGKRNKPAGIKEGDFAYIKRADDDQQRTFVGYWGKIEAKTKQDDAIEVEYSLSLPQGDLVLSDRFPDVPSEAKLVKLKLKGAQKKSWNDLHKRLTRIYQNVSDNRNEENFKEPIVSNLLEYFGRRKQDTFITDLESDLLRAVEDKLKLLDNPLRTDGDEATGDNAVGNKEPDREEATEASNKDKDENNSTNNASDTNLSDSPVETDEPPETQVEDEKKELTPEKAENSTITSADGDDLKKQYAVWRKRKDFLEQTGISEETLKIFFDKKKFEEGQLRRYATFESHEVPVEIDRSKKPFRYRVESDKLLTFSELIEKHPELADYKRFTNKINRNYVGFESFGYERSNKLKSSYLIFQFKCDDTPGLFYVAGAQVKTE